LQSRHKSRLGNVQQRPQQKANPVRSDRQRRGMGHAGQSHEAAAARQPEQHGFRLIVEGMRGEDMGVAGAGGDLPKQPIAGDARGFLQSRFRFSAAPTQRAMRHTQPPGKTLHRSRFARCFRAQAMIDRHRDKLRRPLESLRPARRE
jgi:hypothetical protein